MQVFSARTRTENKDVQFVVPRQREVISPLPNFLSQTSTAAGLVIYLYIAEDFCLPALRPIDTSLLDSLL